MVLSDTDRALIAAIQQGLPLVSRPYATIGAQLGLGETEVIARLTELQDAGMIKRMGVVVRHRALGYRANAMVVWDVPDNELERVGRLLADETCVTLCYQRPRQLPDWPYNLFAMIHGATRAEVEDKRRTIATLLGDAARASDILYSTRILKKTGLRLAGGGS